MRWSIDTNPSPWGRAWVLTPHFDVKHWYWPLTMRWSIGTNPSPWGRALVLTPHYGVERWYWPLTMRWSIDTDPLMMPRAMVNKQASTRHVSFTLSVIAGQFNGASTRLATVRESRSRRATVVCSYCPRRTSGLEGSLNRKARCPGFKSNLKFMYGRKNI